MAYFESVEVEGVSADGRRIRARAILEEGDDPAAVTQSIRQWVDEELERWDGNTVTMPRGLKLKG